MPISTAMTDTPSDHVLAQQYTDFIHAHPNSPMTLRHWKEVAKTFITMFKDVRTRLDELERLVDGKNLRLIEVRTLAAEARMSNIDERFRDGDERMAGVETRAIGLKREVDSLKAAQIPLKTDAALDKRIAGLEEETSAQQKEISELKALVSLQEQQLAEVKAKGIEYRGVWDGSNTYAVGDVVTRQGSMWVSRLNHNKAKPGGDNSMAWTLSCKAGRDGKDGQDLR